MAGENWINGKPNRPRKVLIFSDQVEQAREWTDLLEKNGYRAKLEKEPEQAREKIRRWVPNLIVLDLVQPFDDLLWLCREIRGFCLCPILIFTSVYDEQRVLAFYNSGATECLLRPTDPAVLLARVRTWLNPISAFFSARLTDLESGGVKLCANENDVILSDNTTVSLTNLEFRLLHLLMSRPGFVFESQRIVSLVWGISGKEDTHVLKHVIYRLRKKIEQDIANPHYIRSVPGRGYFFYNCEGMGDEFQV